MPDASRSPLTLQAAVQRIKLTAKLAAERSNDSLGLAVLSATHMRQRQHLQDAQTLLARQIASFSQSFADNYDSRVLDELKPPSSHQTVAGGNLEATAWKSLSLVGDEEVESQVIGDRCSAAIALECEGELRDLDGYAKSLLKSLGGETDRHPFRPELIGKALLRAIDTLTTEPEVRKVLLDDVGRSMAKLMRTTYNDILGDLRQAGIEPLGLTVRAKAHHHTHHHSPSAAGALDSSSGSLGASSTQGGALSGPSTRSPGSGWQATASPEGAAGSHQAGGGGFNEGWRASPGNPAAAAPRGETMGHVDGQLMGLMRRLAFLAQPGSPAPSGRESSASSGLDTGGGGFNGRAAAPNLITAHREALHQAANSAVDHMVIDVVGSLFDQILSDPKVPPQMARQIARLQLPVLRAALGDPTFFSSRKHPVRSFVNRLASLACAFDDFESTAGRALLSKVRDLVQEIVTGDFDLVEVYTERLAQLEAFIAEQGQQEIEQEGHAAQLLIDKERSLQIRQQYMSQLNAALDVVNLDDFLHHFAAQIWGQVIVQAVQTDGPHGALAERMRKAGRDLVMSVLPKGTQAERKAFLSALPHLMKDLNDGLNLIRWPEDQRKEFFAKLLPAHAESLKGESLTQLDFNLRSKQVEGILATPVPLPAEGAPPPGVALPVLDDVVTEGSFNADEAQRIGLITEASIDWNGEVDIDLSADAAASTPPDVDIDINLEGLPPLPADEPEDTTGRNLAYHVQLGFAYQMHTDNAWQKVRLTYISPGRAFFVFKRGQKHSKTISLTERMLARLCETGRFKAFESAYLLERATLRARQQLAALSAKSGLNKDAAKALN